ncbi:hypothetical protein ACA081_00710 [Candidatus Hodgkinia cicadicola]
MWYLVDVLSSVKTAKHNLLKPIIGGKIIDYLFCMFYNCRPAMALKDIELINSSINAILFIRINAVYCKKCKRLILVSRYLNF